MGEVHESSADGLEEFLPVRLDLESNGCQTATMLGKKIYVIGGGSDDDALSIGVRILDKSTGKWEIPTVLGTVPVPCKSHSAVVLNKERILILKRDSAPDDCTWFLEDGLSCKKGKLGDIHICFHCRHLKHGCSGLCRREKHLISGVMWPCIQYWAE